MIPLNGCFYHFGFSHRCTEGFLQRLIWEQFLDFFPQDRLRDPKQLSERSVHKQDVSVKIRICQRCIIGIQNSFQLLIFSCYDFRILTVCNLGCDQLCHAVHEGYGGVYFSKQGSSPVLGQHQSDHTDRLIISPDRYSHKGLHFAVMIFHTLSAACFIPLMLQKHVPVIIKHLCHQGSHLNILIQREILKCAADHIHICICNDHIRFQYI